MPSAPLSVHTEATPIGRAAHDGGNVSAASSASADPFNKTL